ncbi:MAG: hypothetical protein PWR01_2208 [Clostridiales bacterium]|nr:hypothetical protein [Clostridiales bacterium]MDN5281135.1 hypothetical protein [Candidatus Ozemobacter sp.]
MRVLKDFFEAFFPFRCHACSKLTNFNQVLCLVCQKRLLQALHEPKLVEDTICEFPVFTLSSYDSFVSDVIRMIKYRPSRKLLDHLHHAIGQKSLLRPMVNRQKIFVPVPMHRLRRGKRGFNQAEVIAETFAELSANLFSPALTRIVSTRPQAECDEEERFTNLDNAFALEKGLVASSFKGKDIVIVDDVATTGTTIKKCSEQLALLKPARISALVVTHSFRKSAAFLSPRQMRD